MQSAIQGDPYDGRADLTSSALSASLRQFDSPSLWRRAKPLLRDGGDVDGDGVLRFVAPAASHVVHTQPD